MLAENFKTPAELGILDREFDALVTVARMLERQEIPAKMFDLTMIRPQPECGTPGCILGWTSHVLGHGFFGDRNASERRVSVREQLFYYGHNRPFSEKIAKSVTPAQAAMAVRAFLRGSENPWEGIA